jgi:hypothetical protein
MVAKRQGGFNSKTELTFSENAMLNFVRFLAMTVEVWLIRAGRLTKTNIENGNCEDPPTGGAEAILLNNHVPIKKEIPWHLPFK